MESGASALSSTTSSAAGGAQADKRKSFRKDVLSTIHQLVETERISSLSPHFMVQ